MVILPRLVSAQIPTLMLAGLLALETAAGTHAAKSAASTTVITIGDVYRTGVKRLGMNLSGQTFYDSGQMLRNLLFRNPGFEGETWQTILRCKQVTATTCTDGNPYTVWPPDFVKGARFEVISGAGRGQAGVIEASTSAVGSGVTLTFAAMTKAPAIGDYLLVKNEMPGHAEAGWWSELRGDATLTTEFKDLSRNTYGRQALRISAAGPGQSAAVLSYFDSTVGHSFVRLHGMYHLNFRAKGLAGTRELDVQLQRLDTQHGTHTFYENTISLVPAWMDYTFDFPAEDVADAVGTVALAFRVSGASVLLDDVSLTPAETTLTNPTPFRDEVLRTLLELRPGVLRYMDNGTDFGSSLDNMLARPYARQRAGYSTQTTEQADIPLGLHEFLLLCQTIHAEPWYTMPAGTSPEEARRLIEYLAGDAKTPYGAIRSTLGQSLPWTTVFPVIHLELGNEQWNSGAFYGATIADPVAYGARAAEVFRAARSYPAYKASSFDLILGGWAANDWWTGQELSHSEGYDSTAVAPYLFASFNDASSTEAIFGPMLAQPEALDSRAHSLVARQLEAAKKASPPANLAVYEVNLGTMSGTASQGAIDSTVPSLGAGLAVIDHMLLMLRDLGITTQALFALPEFSNTFAAKNGQKETMPLWGSVVDMGGATNRQRPQYLAEKLANEAILPTMLATRVSGADPTWNQPKSTNDGIELHGAHMIQSFAFTDDRGHRSVILLNLSRTETLPVAFAGEHSPVGTVQEARLSGGSITDSNEAAAKVVVTRTSVSGASASTNYALPPHSMTVLTWLGR